MRVDVKKFLFIGPTIDKEQFFHEAQKSGIIEFINPSGQRRLPHSQEVDDYLHAIKILRSYVQEKQEIKKELGLAKTILTTVLNTKQLLDQAEDHRAQLEQEIDLIAPFGNFSIDELHTIEKETSLKIRFYCGKSSKEYEKINSDLILVNSVDGIDYFIAMGHSKITLHDLLEVNISESHTLLKQKLLETKQIIAVQEEQLKQLTRYNWLLHHALVHTLNQLHLHFAQTSITAALDDTLFTIEGWVPKNKLMELAQLTNRLNIFCEEVQINTTETVPTYLENEGAHRVGEDIIHIFDVPSTQDKDPSMWVLCAFSLFFAMIVGDAGYGLIFLLTALVIQWKIGQRGVKVKALARRLVKLTAILGVSCICWGLLTNSFFSISFGPKNPLRTYSLINWLIEKKAEYHLTHQDDVYQFWVAKIPALATSTTGEEFIRIGNEAKSSEHPGEKFSNNILMELALFVGSIHVILGLARYLRKNPIGAGWIAFIIGAYLYLPLYLNATSLINFAFGIPKTDAASFGLQLLCGGVIFSVIGAIIKSGFLGIFEIMTSVQILGDILSYLRIYALALAGAIVSATINGVAGELPLLIATIIIVFAHILNILLSIMGGVIHGLRLNFLEWYHYSFEGGGRKFTPLELHIFD